jgi:hypothetical protein
VPRQFVPRSTLQAKRAAHISEKSAGRQIMRLLSSALADVLHKNDSAKVAFVHGINFEPTPDNLSSFGVALNGLRGLFSRYLSWKMPLYLQFFPSYQRPGRGPSGVLSVRQRQSWASLGRDLCFKIHVSVV